MTDNTVVPAPTPVPQPDNPPRQTAPEQDRSTWRTTAFFVQVAAIIVLPCLGPLVRLLFAPGWMVLVAAIAIIPFALLEFVLLIPSIVRARFVRWPSAGPVTAVAMLAQPVFLLIAILAMEDAGDQGALPSALEMFGVSAAVADVVCGVALILTVLAMATILVSGIADAVRAGRRRRELREQQPPVMYYE